MMDDMKKVCGPCGLRETGPDKTDRSGEKSDPASGDGCPRGFDDTLLTGYLDGELTQAEDQRVRIHLEDCPSCRRTLSHLTTIREVAMNTTFQKPDDDQWKELPRGTGSSILRGFGWGMVILWLVIVSLFAFWQFATGPEDILMKLLIVGGLTGLACLFISVLVDRIKVSRTDPYREVEK